MSEQSQVLTRDTVFDFDKIAVDQRFCDCTIIAEGKEFKSHRVLLCGCSKFFNEYFKDNSITTCTLDSKYTASSFQLFLTFLYTKKINLNLENLAGALLLAFNLKIETLFNTINDYLQTIANPDTALVLLKHVGFALSELTRFMKFCATLMEKMSAHTDFAFLKVPEFKLLIKKARFSNGYVRDDIIAKYCRSAQIDQEQFAEFKQFDPALPDSSLKKPTFSAVCLAAPPDPGLFHRLRDQIGVEASGSLNGRDPATIVEDDPIKHWFTESDGNAWVLFEFKELYIQPTHYGIWSHGGTSTLKNWAFQASNDRQNWIVLSTHNNDESLRKPFSEKTWPLETNGYFKYFRIIQTGHNWSGNRWLYLQKVEIWGVACSKDKF